MAQRILPGAYVSINDMSQLPEGQTALTVGYVLDAKRGPVNELSLVTSPTDFLTKYTFSGKPGVSDDRTFWSILNVLNKTNSMYVCRAANDPLYGSVVVKASEKIGSIIEARREAKQFVFSGDVKDKIDALIGNIMMVYTSNGEKEINGNYVIERASVAGDHTTVTVASAVPIGGEPEAVGSIKEYLTNVRIVFRGNIGARFHAGMKLTIKNSSIPENDNKVVTVLNVVSYNKAKDETTIQIVSSVPVTTGTEENDNAAAYEYSYNLEGTDAAGFVSSCPVSLTKIGSIYNWTTGNRILFAGDVTDKLSLGCQFEVKGCTITANNKTYTVETNEDADPIHFDTFHQLTEVIVKESFEIGTMSDIGDAYFGGLTSLDAYPLNEENTDEILLITGKDPGRYNNDIKIKIRTSVDYPDDFVYRKGAIVGGKEVDFDTIELTVINDNTNETLETFLFSRNPNAKTIDGISLYVDNVVAGSAYIQVRNNEAPDAVDTVPKSTLAGAVTLEGGSDGSAITVENLVGALKPFKDKTVTISILGNGCSSGAETIEFQQALMGVADDRKDLIVFLNNPYEGTERNITISSTRAQKIVDYKKKELANTSFYGCMYSPHVNVSDEFNQRQVKIGAEAVAISGWLDVINTLNYPYAYAGPRNGLVQGVTCDWKIGDMSGEAQLLNDASVNYVAFDGKVGRYYMQCQNTLQVANSSMRNIGTVFNILDIKEHFVTLLKEYLQLPITADLRRQIIDTANDYLSPMLGVRFLNYAFQDVTTDFDLADNTLRYLLTIAPTPYAQKIYLVMNIVNATFDFSVLQSL